MNFKEAGNCLSSLNILSIRIYILVPIISSCPITFSLSFEWIISYLVTTSKMAMFTIFVMFYITCLYVLTHNLSDNVYRWLFLMTLIFKEFLSLYVKEWIFYLNFDFILFSLYCHRRGSLFSLHYACLCKYLLLLINYYHIISFHSCISKSQYTFLIKNNLRKYVKYLKLLLSYQKILIWNHILLTESYFINCLHFTSYSKCQRNNRDRLIEYCIVYK